jgi:mRNA-degrading endonuclease HigB of HigAB toxin-antitoxin module
MVGGVKGVRFDVVGEDLPEGYRGLCGMYCVDIATFSDGRVVFQLKGTRTRLIVLKDVEGKTVTVAFISSATEFDEFAPVAQKVIDSVEWRSS